MNRNLLRAVMDARGVTVEGLCMLTGHPEHSIQSVRDTPSTNPKLVDELVHVLGFQQTDAGLVSQSTDDALKSVVETQGDGAVAFDDIPLMDIAARVSPTRFRPGAKIVQTTVPVIVDWFHHNHNTPTAVLAISGMEAVDGTVSLTPTVYIDSEIALPWRKVPHGAKGVMVLPLTDTHIAYSYTVDGVRLMHPRWAVMDSLASPGRQPDSTRNRIRNRGLSSC